MDPVVIDPWQMVRARIPPQTAGHHWIYFRSVSTFHQRFKDGLRFLNGEHLELRAYSLRRGGATAFYRHTGSRPRTIERGRWGDNRAARSYINDGIAKIVDLNIPKATMEALRH